MNKLLLSGILTFIVIIANAQWRQIYSDQNGISSIAMSDSNIMVGTYLDGTYLSYNNGVSWNSINLSNANFPIDVSPNMAPTALYINGNSFFIGTTFGILFSPTAGTVWSYLYLPNQ